jgi:hypothetical protein
VLDREGRCRQAPARWNKLAAAGAGAAQAHKRGQDSHTEATRR